MLYIFEKIHELPENFPAYCSPYLSPQRREKAFSYRFSLDRKLSVVAYLLLCLNLRENHGIYEAVEFSYGKNGKPFLRDYPRLHFSLSHCRCAVACAVSHCAVGVDVQDFSPVSDALAERVLTPTEYAIFKNAKDPLRCFCEFWTAKESFLKRSGDGIGDKMSALSSECIDGKVFFEGKDYMGCALGPCGPIRRIETPEQLLYAGHKSNFS